MTVTEVTVPIAVPGSSGHTTLQLAAIEYRPAAPGRLPAIVLSHGAPGDARARETYTGRYPEASAVFVEWGFVVLSPLRRGYGKSDGLFAEDYGSCEQPALPRGRIRDGAGHRGGRHLPHAAAVH